jgi:osmotically-inducible protein OsmY
MIDKRFHLTAGILTMAGLAIAGSLGWPAAAETAPAGAECAEGQPAKDLWIDMRLETAYLFNPHLNNLAIDTNVENGKVQLSGTVRSDIDRDLAAEIAKSLDGVASVDNDLEVRDEVEQQQLAEADQDFLQKVKDATTTAQVKTRLIGNENVSASDIDVDTDNSVVRLSGAVRSDAERQLAELIARNTAGVKSVENELEIRRSS